MIDFGEFREVLGRVEKFCREEVVTLTLARTEPKSENEKLSRGGGRGRARVRLYSVSSVSVLSVCHAMFMDLVFIDGEWERYEDDREEGMKLVARRGHEGRGFTFVEWAKRGLKRRNLVTRASIHGFPITSSPAFKAATNPKPHAAASLRRKRKQMQSRGGHWHVFIPSSGTVRPYMTMSYPGQKRRYYDGSGGGGMGDDSFDARKRRRVDATPMNHEDRIEALILKLGDRSSQAPLESNLNALAGVLEQELSTSKAKIIRIVTDCALAIPEKITIYSTLVGLVNAKSFSFGQEFVESLSRTLKESLRDCAWEKARFVVRLMADSVNCNVITVGSFLQILDAFLDVLGQSGIPQARKDYFCYLILSNLPWVGSNVYAKKPEEIARYMRTISQYMSRGRKKQVSRLLRVWSMDKPHVQEELLSCLWAQICKLSEADNWQEKHILRPYVPFKSTLSAAVSHNLPLITVPPHEDKIVYPLPQVVFRLFDYTDCPDPGPVLPGAHSIERYLIEEELGFVMETYGKNRKDCAARMVEVGAQSKVPIEYMVVETVFAHMLRLPHAPRITLFYTSLLIDLCRLQPMVYPQVLAQATEMFFTRIDTMNVTSFQRLLRWFSVHLSNFQFRWAWDDWEMALSLPNHHPKRKFIQEVLVKCVRLSYHQRIMDTLPENFGPLAPSDTEFIFKYGVEDAGIPGTQACSSLITLIQEKASPEDVVNHLKGLPNPQEEEEGGKEFNPLQIDVFSQAILKLGAKTISHNAAAMAKFNPVFKEIAKTDDAKLRILKNVFDFWRNNSLKVYVCVDKLLKLRTVDCSAVANLVFSLAAEEDFTQVHLWELLNLALSRMNKHVARIEDELKEAKERVKKCEGEEDSDDSDREDAGGAKVKKEKQQEARDLEADVEKWEDQFERAQESQKNLFLIIFQRFIMILTEHIVRCDTDGVDFKTWWYHWTLGYLEQIFIEHHDEVFKFKNTLETLLFTPELDANILELFNNFVALRM
ncbi:unnamed protein product [Cyprideis torosa]|uniref:Nuclear cap-binding protein subunit 1 n=1 Tax=Cyprideis torosa TaxID=163714 RepID=A0A7R8W7Z7_9CRUS|nr:unnamed protein product [Cyprideis torosa]CAG0888086.1 unnamed protein product [Cyprideis torosa]